MKEQKISWQGRTLTFALRAYRLWSALQPQDLASQRASMNAFGARLVTAPDVQVTALTVEDCLTEWVTQRIVSSDRVMLYLHGGAYNAGSLASHRSLVTHIAAISGIRALSLAYRLAPEHPYPTAIEDATNAYRWLLTQGFTPDHLIIAGDSAGGGLAVATLVALHNQHISLPAGAVLLSPWTDLSDHNGSWEKRAATNLLLTPPSLHTAAHQYLGKTALQTPLASPRCADLHGLPPLLIQVGSDELLLDDIKDFAEQAKAAGVQVYLEEWSKMFHVWHLMVAFLPEAQQAIKRIKTFVEEQIRDT